MIHSSDAEYHLVQQISPGQSNHAMQIVPEDENIFISQEGPVVKRNFTTLSKVPSISTIQTNKREGTLTVQWRDGTSEEFAYIWLRDHCTCNRCTHPVTMQRQIDTLSIPLDIAPQQVMSNSDSISIEWGDHTSTFSSNWLKKKGSLTVDRPKAQVWGSEILQNLPQMNFQELMDDQHKGMSKWMNLIQIHGFALLQGVPATPEETKKVIESIGPLKNSIYGQFWDIVFQDKNANPTDIVDTAYVNEAIAPHTDGCYFFDQPGLQFFHFLQAAPTGGETVLVDGFKIAADLKKNHKEAFEFFSTHKVPFYHINDSEYYYQDRYIFQLDDNGEMLRFSYNNDDRASVSLPASQMKTYYSHLQKLLSALQDPNNQIKFICKPGSLLVTNNWRVMHARTAFRGRRRMVGSYIAQDDFQSRRVTSTK